jgi:6,7-dimethyl-8-ribityllumazine synthase
MNLIQGQSSARPEGRFVLVAARFHDFIVERLIDGAREMLAAHGVDPDRIDLVRVPGAFEIAQAATRAAASGRYVAVIALGCVIRGGTPHFDYVAGAAATGLAQCARDSGIPVLFGVLTTDDVDQAMERAGGKYGNKGADAALAAIEMADLWERL